MYKETPETVVSCSVRETQNGKGLFANEDIRNGEVLFKIAGNPISYKDAVSMDENESYCLQVDINTYIIPHFPFFISNHSCEPNCGINNELEFIAITDIHRNSELRWDYSTSMLERHWEMECNCNSPSCRKYVMDFDTLPLYLQKKYTQTGIVMPFILRFFELIKKMNFNQYK